ncbi:MAG TPA: calcium-binding protein, partial [Allosphingosinicella sp.]
MAIIWGTRGDDSLTGTEESDRLRGLGGNDTIQTAGLGDWMYGGPGNDLLISSDTSASALYGESGNDILVGGSIGEEMNGGSGDDTIHGGGGSDRIWTEERLGSDIIYGDDGDDSIRVTRRSAGSTIEVFGGNGADTIALEIRAGNTIKVDAGGGNDVVSVLALWATSELGASTITLGAGRDTISVWGYNSGAVYSGATVTDFQTGANGDFVDFMSLLRVYTSFAWVYSANPFTAGFARLQQSGADTLLQFASTANGSFATALTFKNVSASTFTSENLGVSPTGQAEADRAESGSEEADLLIGGAGSDTLSGSGGRDRLFGGDGADSLDGGEGNDAIRGGFGNDTIHGGAGADNLAGDGGDDVIHGGDDDDTLSDSENGNDALYGDGGDDSLTMSRIGGGSVALNGGEGNDHLMVSGWAAGGVTIDGGSGADTILLNSVTGSLDRPAGAITITTGTGRDLVEISAPVHSTNAPPISVLDFTAGAGGDRVDMTTFLRFYAYGLAVGANPFASGHSRLLQSGSDTLLQFSENGTAGGFVTILTFRNTQASAFTSANFDGFSPNGTVSAPLVLSGSDDGDALEGDGGGDTIGGHGGDDTLYGFSGNDTLRGGSGHDALDGGFGDDLLEGGEDNDRLSGGAGNDEMHGGAGHDYLDAFDGGSDRLYGGDGNDSLNVSSNSASDHMVMDGGAGLDSFYVSMSGGGTYSLDAGAGRDSITVASMSGVGTIALGADSDILRIGRTGSGSGSITLTDFEAGDGGDTIDFDEWLASELTNYNTALSPFDTGHLRLVESGTNLILQRDMNGGGDGFVNWITFRNTGIWTLTDFNLDGYAIPNRSGTGTVASDRFQGAAGSDNFVGGGGNDLFLIGYGGTDRAIGNIGTDMFFVALRPAGSDSHVVDGAGDTDTLQLQGRASQTLVTLGTSTASGNLLDISSVEKLQLLSGFDASRAWNGTLAIEYRIHLQDAATQSGTVFTLDASGLATGERVQFSSTETNAQLHLLGGAGSDELAGGALGDQLTGGAGDDKLDGGAGDDVLNGGAGADVMTGGSDNDIYHVDDGGDSVVELADGGTADEVRTMLSSYTLAANVERLTGLLGSGQALAGNGLANRIAGAAGHDTLDGGGGADELIGGLGNDIYIVDAAGDIVTENAGEGTDEVRTTLETYALPANVETLTFAGTGTFTATGDDRGTTFKGGSGSDFIDAGGGGDFIDLSRGGDDSASGGSGRDGFYFGSALTSADSADGGADRDYATLAGDYWTVPLTLGEGFK